jgi:hypothetical protein
MATIAAPSEGYPSADQDTPEPKSVSETREPLPQFVTPTTSSSSEANSSLHNSVSKPIAKPNLASSIPSTVEFQESKQLDCSDHSFDQHGGEFLGQGAYGVVYKVICRNCYKVSGYHSPFVRKNII